MSALWPLRPGEKAVEADVANGARARLRAEQRDRALNEDVAHADACDASLLAYDGDMHLNERDMGAAYHALHTVR